MTTPDRREDRAEEPERRSAGPKVVIESSGVKHVDERAIERFWLLRRVGRHPKALQPCW
jgi:hypothetical protein